MAPGGFHNIEGSDDIGFNVGARILKAVSNASLCSQMHNNVRRELVCHLVEQLQIFQHPFCGREVFILQKHLVAALLQGDVIIIRHPVEAMHAKTFFQQKL